MSIHHWWHGSSCWALVAGVFHTMIRPVLSAENILLPNENPKEQKLERDSLFSYFTCFTKLNHRTFVLINYKWQNLQNAFHFTHHLWASWYLLIIEYLQCQNRRCWWNWSGPQTPPATGHSIHQHQVSTLGPQCHSHRWTPGSGLWGDTGHSTQMRDGGEPSGLFQEACPHSTLWRAGKRMETLFCREEMESSLSKHQGQNHAASLMSYWIFGITTPPRGDGKNNIRTSVFTQRSTLRWLKQTNKKII